MSWTTRWTCDRCGFQAARWTDAQRHDERHLTEDIAVAMGTGVEYPQPRPTIDPAVLERTQTRRGR